MGYLNEKLYLQAPGHLDWKLKPFSSKAVALASMPYWQREIGQVVNVVEGGRAIRYRFIKGILDADLVVDYSLSSSGCVEKPTITDNLDGSITVSNFKVGLYQCLNGCGAVVEYDITGDTFILNDNAMNYIVVDYNSGTPIVKNISDVNLITETTIIPVYSVFRTGTILHSQNWDELALSLSNKLHQSIVKTDRYRRQSGLALSVYGTRSAQLTDGIVWVGASPITLSEINTDVDMVRFYKHVAGSWVLDMTSGSLNNIYYDDGTDLVELTANRYAVAWLWRGVESQKHLYCLAGTGDYKLVEAQAASAPVPPVAISSHAVLVGKIIFVKGVDTPVSIQSAFETRLGTAVANVHNDLTGRDADDSHPESAITLEAFTDLTIASGATTWDCSTGKNKTVSASTDFTLTISNVANGMFGVLNITLTGTTTITLSTGLTNKGAGELTSLTAGNYVFCFEYDGSIFHYNINEYL